MNEPKVSIVIVNYNVKQLLIDCLISIYKYCNRFSFEIIVVDNDSYDGSVEAIHERFPEVVIIKNNINIGFPAGNNQAFKIVKGEYIMMLNPDTVLIDDSFSIMLDFIESHADVSLVGPKLLNSDGSRQLSVWKFPRIKYILAEMLYLNKLTPDRFYMSNKMDEPFEVESISGAAMLFKKDLLDEVGLLNEYLFWIEDVDFCYRIKKKGGSVYYLPQTEVIHHIGGSAKTNYTISLSNQIFNKIKFYKVHQNTIKKTIVVFLSFINASIRFIIFGLLSPFKRVYYLKSKAYLYIIPRVFNPPAKI
ncbi:glycosyltransferase family 2 protein [Bacteroidota bacterium]